MKLVTANQMRALEQRADANGNLYAQMMERAGKAVADVIEAQIETDDAHVLVLVGPGNNGGDGLVCARYLHDAGMNVSLYIWKRAENSADENWRLCREREFPETRAESDPDFATLKTWVSEADVIVDALLGTGVARPIEGQLKDLLAITRFQAPAYPVTELIPSPFAMRHSPLVVAIDLPSGLNPDTGALDPAALHADLTVTFAFPKIGQFAFPGANAVGELIVADIGIPSEWADANATQVASTPEIAALLPTRARDSHKGTFGKAMLCVGSANYVGAAFLAGAGLVTLALARTIYPLLASTLHETTFIRLPDDDGVLIPSAADVLCNQFADYDALLVGCGFGRDPKTIAFVQTLLEQNRNSPLATRNFVFDADALYALSQTDEWWKQLAPNTAILTPHPGEMATLTGLSRAEVQANRIEVAKKFAAQWQQVVALKGAFTVVASPDGRTTVLPFATPALATAGTGDVLAGTITAMLAQKLAPFDAAVVGAYIHGLAGEIAAREIGNAGVVAGDLLPSLPVALSQLLQSKI